jgi:tetratricopeptide (TPR) repeat protein
VLSIDFDGTGRLAYQRTTGGGLNESVISNGTHLWHLYAELGLGARRELSRFHRALLLRMIPWALPPVDDLARGADLRALGKRTVAVVPRGAESAKDKDGKPIHYVAVRLVFGADDRLAERRMVQMPSGKLIVRQVLGPDGTVRWLGRRGELIVERKCRLEACGAPDLEPNTESLVVLPMPLRSREHLRRSLKAEGGIDYERVSEDVALALIASQLGTPEATEIIARRFLAPGDRRLGLYVLWLAGGVERAPEEEAEGPDEEEARAAEGEEDALRFDPLADHPDEPLAEYLAGYVESRQGDDWSEIGPIGGPSEGFVQQLAWFRDLRVRWASAGELEDSPEARKRHEQLARQTIDFIRRSTSRARAWAMFTILLDEVEVADDKRQLASMAAEIALSFEDVPGVSYKARYEHARLLAQAGEHEQARQLIAGLYDEGLQLGVMLPVDRGFRELFFDEAEEPWQEFVGNLSAEVTSRGGRRAAIRLAQALHQMEEAELAEEVFSQAVAAGPQPMPWATTLDAVEYLCGAGKHARADAVLDRLVARQPYSDVPALWRLAAAIAEKRGMTARSLACRERAMELEYDALPEMVELAPIRQQHGDLLDRYQELARATGALGTDACGPLIAQVVRTADRWRSLDVDPDGACQKAARILTDLGATDLAWDYLTTAAAGDAEESLPWNDLAETFRQEGRYGLADRAYAWASAGDPANAGILWNRAQSLLESGRNGDAEPLLRELADGDWADEHEPLKSRAKEYLEE